MSCNPPKRDNSKHKLLHTKNASSLVTIMKTFIIYTLPYRIFALFAPIIAMKD